MLIVRRRAGQAILIGDQVEVHVLEIQPGRVKLGVVAPRAIPV
ncbi:MAG: carbon storage regulator, partial [Bryobacteraceae bacterium]